MYAHDIGMRHEISQSVVFRIFLVTMCNFLMLGKYTK